MSQTFAIYEGHVIIRSIYMQAIDGIFYVIVLIMSVVIHEYAHGYTAYRFGDNTARMAGRLTLNPIKHLDLFGSIILPLLLIVSHAGFVIGWAKPVPVNPYNLKKGKWPSILVSISGILANILVAFIFGLFIRVAPVIGFASYNALSPASFYIIAQTIVLLNIVLAIFNLIPIPPLDGSKILFEFLPAKYRHWESVLERWGMLILLFFVFFVWKFLAPLIFFIFSLFTGIY